MNVNSMLKLLIVTNVCRIKLSTLFNLQLVNLIHWGNFVFQGFIFVIHYFYLSTLIKHISKCYGTIDNQFYTKTIYIPNQIFLIENIICFGKSFSHRYVI
jgi:hypothetical protein